MNLQHLLQKHFDEVCNHAVTQAEKSVSVNDGAYIFGDSYPEQTFKAFFDELKSYGAKYVDSANKVLYFTKSTAKNVHGDFKSIFDKYRAQVGEELRKKRIVELEDTLAKLKA